MAVWIIPTPANQLAFSQDIDLDGRIFHLEFMFNVRANRWMVDTSTSDGVELLNGRVLNHGLDLYNRFVNGELPIGFAAILDSSGEDKDPDLENFGKDCVLYFDDELEA